MHTLAASNQDLFEREIEQFKRLNGIDQPQQLAQACQTLQDQNRLMNIGIVGRVKAGKSSLLNALIFDGEPILPKAATPMTAALTTITWGEVFQAKVEFYSETDIAAIRFKSDQFEQRLAARKRECLEELVKRRNAQANDAPLDMAQLTLMADKKAMSELQREEGLFAAYDQYQRMKRSGLDAATLHLHSEIQAGNPKELAARLHNYVGADGTYMPFTKTVHVAMPLEALRDICIIDTPGMNDPVQSREERTVELLKTCDVVFIVSPAGQFLNEQDLEVMGRITQKEGIQELVLVASQIDTQLYGSEKRARLSDAVEAIRTQLSARAQSTLTDLKLSSPEVGSVFDNLIGSVHRNLLHSSGLCHSLNRRFNSQETWDSNEQVTWDNLSTDYPDYFTRDNQELSLSSLDSLANIDAINAMLAQVREKKAEITREKIANLMVRKQKNLEAFKALLINLARNQVIQIKNANVDQLDEQLASLESKRLDLSLELDVSFKYTMADYRQKLRDDMRKIAAQLLRETQSTVKDAEGSFSETITVDNDGVGSWIARKLWGGGTTEKTVVRAKIISSQVISTINEFMNDIQDELGAKVESSHRGLNEELARNLTPKIREVLEQDANGQMIKLAINSIIDSIPDDDFDLSIPLPESLKSNGTLKGYEAERFKDAADDFIGSLGSKVKSKISSFINDVERKAPSTISDSFVDEIQRRINVLKDQVDNAAQTIDRLERLARKAEEVTL
ncbi:dynamin family protein [Pseudomonas lactucae]|uniref:Dynamin family protein n=1 Tax=Pseudomonas lactucae TaxID=2813360 RepID=A0A9X1C4I4_9PSED|nr:dynamin family protein [Pseudomonas lactucae]MBN2975035.1 dynamin family protein [Pseudomonas lactucae]MBN2985264.1 dynamin family protein [Pseudomonas lactucae]